MNDKEWLAHLKPGDKAVVPGRWSDPGRVVRVDRLTATQIVMTNGERFRRDCGRAVGRSDKWHTPWLQPVSQEFLTRIEKRDLRAWLNSVVRDDLPIETLRALKAAYDAASKEPA